MARMERFEDMLSWQKARGLTNRVYMLLKQGNFSRNFDLRGQMRRASVSIMSNIAKGFERGGDKKFLQFLSTAKGSCGEVRSQLYTALDQTYVTQGEFDARHAETTEVADCSPALWRTFKNQTCGVTNSKMNKMQKTLDFRPGTLD